MKKKKETMSVETFENIAKGLLTRPTWVIHSVFPTEYDVKKDENSKYCCNHHTHGLDNYGHRELCIPFPIEQKTAGVILNTMGYMIANGERTFEEGFIDGEGILANGYNLWGAVVNDDPTLYIFVPDVNNKFPYDEDCDESFKEQLKYMEYVSKDKDYV